MVDHHPVLLRTPSFEDGARAQQLILERTDPEFIPAILDELGRPGGTVDLLRTRAASRTGDKVLKLFQPVQRTFNVALFEVVCDVPGQPRFDPARIESAGMVVRRVGRHENDPLHRDELEAWCQDGRTLKGWLPLAEELDRDPDATRRSPPSAGNAELDRRFALWRGPTRRLSEAVSPLFPAPPEVCRALGKTVLFGVVPVTSADLSEYPPDGWFKPDEVRQRLSAYLKGSLPVRVPWPGEWLTRHDADDRELKPWINMLRQLVYELDAFGASRKSRELFDALEEIRVPLVKIERPYDFFKKHPDYHRWIPTRSAGELLRQHAEVLVLRSSEPEQRSAPWPDYPNVRMPYTWPWVPGSVAAKLAAAAQASLEARLAATVRPRRPRFEQRARAPEQPSRKFRVPRLATPATTADTYCLRAFVRLRHHEHCPPRVVWSGYSEPFAIAPWYEGTGAPPVPISLPDPTDKNFLKSLKPNVAFAIPGSLFKLLEGSDPKKLLAGKGSAGGPSEPAWLCGFNIPIITICAFILLSIMLVLLHMIFFWLPFVKICIPYPRSLRSPVP